MGRMRRKGAMMGRLDKRPAMNRNRGKRERAFRRLNRGIVGGR